MCEEKWITEYGENQCGNCYEWLEEEDMYCRKCGGDAPYEGSEDDCFYQNRKKKPYRPVAKRFRDYYGEETNMKTKVIALTLSLALMLGVLSGNVAFAEKGAFLSSKKLTISKNKSKTLKVKNTKAKVKWKIVSGKKNITIRKKGKTAVMVRGKSNGTSKVQANVGRKKLFCKVIVKNAKKTISPEPVTPVAPDPITPILPAPIVTVPPSPIFSQSPTATAPPLGSHEEDVAVLKKIIAQQRAQGATVSEDLNNDDEYKWDNNGRLWYIFWYKKNLSGILDMSGLYALKQLTCHDNNLSGLDVRDNQNLESLACNDNQLSSLDLSRNVNLKQLNCPGNQLENLILNSSNLESLSCSSNRLSSLDVSNSVNLKILWCNDNKLESLIINSANLESLSCSSNQLSALDVSNSVNLKTLGCEDNELSSIDVSHNENLEKLVCDDNQLSSLDVSRNVNLKDLSCSHNQLSTLDVSRNANLEKLDCLQNQLSILDLSNNKKLSSLLCSYTVTVIGYNK